MYVLYITGRITSKSTGETHSQYALISVSDSYMTILKKLFSWIEEAGYGIVEWYPDGNFCVISKSDDDVDIYATINIDSVEKI